MSFTRLTRHLNDKAARKCEGQGEDGWRVAEATTPYTSKPGRTRLKTVSGSYSNPPLLLAWLMYASHASLRDLYEVSTPELDALVAIARSLPGCYGARLTGAGFGGCTVNLVEESKSQAFIEALGVEYTAKTGREARIYLCHASQGASAERL